MIRYYVCDACGHYWTAQIATACLECKAERVWEFDRPKPARDHSAHVKRIAQSPLFKVAR
jgi:hypothetical protein